MGSIYYIKGDDFMKRKRLLTFILILSILVSNTGMVFAANRDINLVIDNEKIDIKLISKKGRTLLPMRKVFEMLGAEVEWNDAKKEVTGRKDNVEVKLTIGSKIAKVNDETFELDLPAQIINSLTYVPVRFVGEALGSDVDWDHDTRTVLIDSDKEILKDLIPKAPVKEDKLSEKAVYNSMVELYDEYPNWTKWDNSNKYSWKGGLWGAGYGCVGFAFMLSDAAFGDLPARKITNLNNLRVGDIVRINGDTHSIIILEINGDEVITAEGNIAGMILWGMTYSLEEIKEYADYAITRYPK